MKTPKLALLITLSATLLSIVVPFKSICLAGEGEGGGTFVSQNSDDLLDVASNRLAEAIRCLSPNEIADLKVHCGKEELMRLARHVVRGYNIMSTAINPYGKREARLFTFDRKTRKVIATQSFYGSELYSKYPEGSREFESLVAGVQTSIMREMGHLESAPTQDSGLANQRADQFVKRFQESLGINNRQDSAADDHQRRRDEDEPTPRHHPSLMDLVEATYGNATEVPGHISEFCGAAVRVNRESNTITITTVPNPNEPSPGSNPSCHTPETYVFTCDRGAERCHVLGSQNELVAGTEGKFTFNQVYQYGHVVPIGYFR